MIVGPPTLLDPGIWDVFYISALTTLCFVLLLCVYVPVK